MKTSKLIPLIALAFFAATAMAGAVPLSSTAAPGTIAAAHVSGLRDAGRASNNTRVDVAVELGYRHSAELGVLISAQRDAASGVYRRFLTRQQFRNYFAASPETYATVAAALRSAGFQVETFPNRTVVHAFGSPQTAEHYFRTEIHRVILPDGRTAYANVRPAVIPRELAGARVEGLNNIVQLRAASGVRVGSPQRSARVAGPLFGPDGGFGPVAIAQTEDFPVQHGYTGTNVNTADVIDGNVVDADVASFLGYYGIKRTGPRTTRLRIDGGCGTACFDTYGADIDAEWALAMAPGTSMFTYQMPSLANIYIVDAFNRVASDDAVDVVNFSVGGCEVNLFDLVLALQPLVAQGAAQGISYENVAFGSVNACGLGLPLPQAPADLDTATAIGGSNVVVDQLGRFLAETGFPSSNGGVSIIVPLPPWQAKTPGVNRSGRNVPDLVLPSQVDGTGPSVYAFGSWQGGFSFVNNAPFAGYLATVQQMNGGRIGNAAPLIYSVFNKRGYSSGGQLYFRDVTLGCNGVLSGKPVCARRGYDFTGGIGSMGSGYNVARQMLTGPIVPPFAAK